MEVEKQQLKPDFEAKVGYAEKMEEGPIEVKLGGINNETYPPSAPEKSVQGILDELQAEGKIENYCREYPLRNLSPKELFADKRTVKVRDREQRVDFCVVLKGDKYFFLEVDGEHHFRETRFLFGAGRKFLRRFDNPAKKLRVHQLQDQKKNTWCRDNNVPLFRLSDKVGKRNRPKIKLDIEHFIQLIEKQESSSLSHLLVRKGKHYSKCPKCYFDCQEDYEELLQLNAEADAEPFIGEDPLSLPPLTHHAARLRPSPDPIIIIMEDEKNKMEPEKVFQSP